MRTRFIACDACSRHVRAGDPRCPFCGAAAPEPPRVERTFGRGISRAAMFAAGTAGVVVAMADCGSGNVTSTAFYGAAGPFDATASDAGDETDSNVGGAVFYGVACPDCGVLQDSAPAVDARDAEPGDATEGGSSAGDAGDAGD